MARLCLWVCSEGRFNRFNSVRSLQWLQMCHKMARSVREPTSTTKRFHPLTRRTCFLCCNSHRALKEVEDKQKRSDPRHRDSVVHWE